MRILVNRRLLINRRVEELDLDIPSVLRELEPHIRTVMPEGLILLRGDIYKEPEAFEALWALLKKFGCTMSVEGDEAIVVVP